MSQYEVYEFLKKNKGKKFTRLELMRELNLTEAAICKNLSKLVSSEFINQSFRQVDYLTKKLTNNGIRIEKLKKTESLFYK